MLHFRNLSWARIFIFRIYFNILTKPLSNLISHKQVKALSISPRRWHHHCRRKMCFALNSGAAFCCRLNNLWFITAILGKAGLYINSSLFVIHYVWQRLCNNVMITPSLFWSCVFLKFWLTSMLFSVIFFSLISWKAQVKLNFQLKFFTCNLRIEFLMDS